MAVVQLRNPTEGRAFFDAKKAAGKTSMEAMRALKRRLSNVVYARMIADQRQRERQTRQGIRDDSAIQRDRPNPDVNGQVAVPAGGHEKVPTPRGFDHMCSLRCSAVRQAGLQ
ncbi:MAG TPA: hypothetical protein VHH53_01665 [Pseudonocardiaceae bacterium]|nr:hypothetical protein [Pseudonocardiaceae bacterium]